MHMQQLYCNDMDVMVHLAEDLPTSLKDADDHTGEGDMSPDSLAGRLASIDLRRQRLVSPASAWIDSVFRTTAPFPSIGKDHNGYIVKEADQSWDDVADRFALFPGEEFVVYTPERADNVGGFYRGKSGGINKIFTIESTTSSPIIGLVPDYLLDDENVCVVNNYAQIALVGTPELIKLAAVEMSVALAMTILHRNAGDMIVKAWRDQAATTLGVVNGFATVRPHPIVGHNTGSVALFGQGL